MAEEISDFVRAWLGGLVSGVGVWVLMRLGSLRLKSCLVCWVQNSAASASLSRFGSDFWALAAAFASSYFSRWTISRVRRAKTWSRLMYLRGSSASFWFTAASEKAPRI